MARLRKETLLDQVLSGIRSAGWNVVFINDTHPYHLSIFRGDQTFRVRVYVWNVTHGGGEARPAAEYRIQITGVALPLVAPLGFQTLLFGWYEDRGVIAAFDPERHRHPSAASPSIQIARGTLDEAAARGLAVQRRGNDEIAIAFRPDLLITYIENQRALHNFAGNDHAIDLLVQAGQGLEPAAEELEGVPQDRGIVISRVARRRRESHFRDRVLGAYTYACAMCHVQLELVEGAHIISVGVPGSTDETSNGIALCPLHHEAYDDGLVGVRHDYVVVVNEAEFQRLRQVGLGGEEQRFRAELKPQIILPGVIADRPRPEYLARGLEIRGWAAGV